MSGNKHADSYRDWAARRTAGEGRLSNWQCAVNAFFSLLFYDSLVWINSTKTSAYYCSQREFLESESSYTSGLCVFLPGVKCVMRTHRAVQLGWSVPWQKLYTACWIPPTVHYEYAIFDVTCEVLKVHSHRIHTDNERREKTCTFTFNIAASD